MNARVDIKIGINGRKRLWDEPFKPTITNTSSYHVETDLDSFGDPLSDLVEVIVDEVEDVSTEGWQSTVHAAIRLDNPTHPPVGSGVVPLAKAHRDTVYTADELGTKEEFFNTLSSIIAQLRTTAKY